MYRTIIVIAGILAVAAAGPYSAFSRAVLIHGHAADQVVNHSGPTDRNGCHEDGSGGYHCH